MPTQLTQTGPTETHGAIPQPSPRRRDGRHATLGWPTLESELSAERIAGAQADVGGAGLTLLAVTVVCLCHVLVLRTWL